MAAAERMLCIGVDIDSSHMDAFAYSPVYSGLTFHTLTQTLPRSVCSILCFFLSL